MIAVSLQSIRDHNPCRPSWEQLLRHTRPHRTARDLTYRVPLRTIIDLLGLDDALWAFRALDKADTKWGVLTTCDVVEPAMQYIDDPRPMECLCVMRAWARGEATAAERTVALAAAWAAERVAEQDVARAVEWAAARAAVWAAVWSTELIGTRNAALEAARAVAWATAQSTEWGIARDAHADARAEQEKILRDALAHASRGERLK